MNNSDFFVTVERIFHDWNYGHPKALYGLIRMLHPQTVVEIGTYRGYAAAYMARAIQENNHGRLYCIDDFSSAQFDARMTPQHWQSNLRECGVDAWASLIIGKSSEVEFPPSVDFAYIDGWHSYEQAKKDFIKCSDLGAEVITLDDVRICVGPRKLIHEIRKSKEWDVITLSRDGGLGVCVRKGPKGNVEFAQELPDHPGTDVKNREKLVEHLKMLPSVTGHSYDIKELVND